MSGDRAVKKRGPGGRVGPEPRYSTTMLWLAFALACTSTPTDPVGASDPVVVDDDPPTVPVLPALSVTSPRRAAFTGGDPVRLSGRVTAGSAALAGATVGEVAVPLDADGAFDVALTPAPGLNILSMRVEDEGGERAVDGRAFIAGDVHPPGVVVEGGVRIVLGPDMLDDDDADVDDVARIAELVLADPSLLGDLLGVPLDTGFAVVTPTALSYSRADVDLSPVAGRLEAVVSLHDLELAYDVDDVAGYSWLSTSGTATADELVLSVDLVAHDGVRIAAVDTEAALDRFALSVDWFPDFLEPTLAEWVQGTLEEELAIVAETTLSELLGGVVDALAVQTSFQGIDLDMTVSGLESVADGLRVTMDVALSAAPAINLPAGAGSVATDATFAGWPDGRDAPFSVMADDDVVNQLLFAFWSSGALGGFSFSGPELAALSGSDIPPPLGPAASVTLDAGLPAVLGPPPDAEADASLGLGELGLVFTREDGVVFAFSVSARTGALLDVNDAGELTFDLDDRPARVELAVGTVVAPAALDPGDLAALVRLVTPPLLGNATAFLPGFPAPSLDLYALTGLDSLAGVELRLQDPAITVQPDGGALVLTGALSDG